MSEPELERCLVMADAHGSYEPVARALDAHDLDQVTPVFAGDFINGGYESARVLQLILDSGAIAVAGNHEYGLLKVLTDPESCDASDWRVGTHGSLMMSYGLRPTKDRLRAREELLEAMGEQGHLAVIYGMRPYLETATAVVVHAGLEPTAPWEEQKAELDAVWTPERRTLEKPTQIFDPNFRLASLTELPIEVTEKDVVSGHWHLPYNARRLYPRRVQLGSAPPFEPVFALELPTRQITPYER